MSNEGGAIKVSYLAPENSGVGWYRFHQPLTELQEQGKIELDSWGFDFTSKKFELPNPERFEELLKADTLIFGRRDEERWFYLIRMAKARGKRVLLDIDDNIFSITPYLPASQFYAADGSAMNIHLETAKLVDGIVVSTPALKDIYDKLNKNVWLVPNGVKNIYPRMPKSPNVRIGFLCSGSHLENASVIESAVIKTLQKHPSVQLLYTKAFQGFMDLVPQDVAPRVHYLPFYPLDRYHDYIRNLNLDIGLAPLMRNDFNRCKSNIRVLEYWQHDIVAVASPLDEYAKTITSGFDGYLAEDDEWESVLDDLIRNPQRRDYLARNSRTTLKKYDISVGAEKYWEILNC